MAFRCNHCTYESSRKGNLNQHIKSVHLKIKCCKCDRCDYECSEKGSLNRHINSVHLKLRDFKCDRCDYECRTKGHLTNHINSVHLKLKGFKEGWVTTQRQWTKVTEDTGVGDPSASSAEKGKAFLEMVTREIGAFLADLEKTEIDDLYE